MANICTVCAAFFAENEQEQVGLRQLYDAIEANQKGADRSIENLLETVGLDPDSFPGTGLYIAYVDDFFTAKDGREAHFTIDCDCRWSPHEFILKALAERFGCQMVYVAEEPGFDIFVNSDTEDRFFGEKYHLYAERNGVELEDNFCSELDLLSGLNDEFGTDYAALEDLIDAETEFDAFYLSEYEAG